MSLAFWLLAVTVAIGIRRWRAIWLTRWTSGVTFWLLYTHTLIAPLRAWASTACLSCAVTSVPSAIAFTKL